MNPTTTGADSKRRAARRGGKDDGGFALTWFALFLLVLIAMAGFGVDVWNWWYTSQKVQRAADAGALAGVTFLPSNIPGAKSAAVSAVQQNGYIDGGTTSVVAAPGTKSNQLDVTVGQTVNNIFTSLLGVRTTTISRKATAEFNAPIEMGSPAGHLGNDPENGATDKHWLNIGAPAVNKQTGDRYADYTGCTQAYLCNGATNTEYLDGTYVFTVEVPASSAGSDVDIQAYDPEYANGNTKCDNQWLLPGQLTTLTSIYPDAATRYGGANDYCTGDDNTALTDAAHGQATVWIVRDSSVSQFQPLSNPVVANGGPTGTSCAHQFKGYSPPVAPAAADPNYWANLLTPASGTYDSDFAASFHRWYTVCHIPSAAAGKYFIQVRSNVPYGTTPLDKDESTPQDTTIGGQNRYSIRAVTHGTGTAAPGVQTYAETHLPVYTNTTGVSTPNFYLARLLPGGGTVGRTLHLVFYDIGDIAGGTTAVTVSYPQDAGFVPPTPPTCSWTANGYGTNPPSGMPTSTVSGCTVSGITSNLYTAGFQGVLVTADITVPADYTCDSSRADGCWFRIQMTYTGGAATQANDTTTWDASIKGDPVRLVK